MTPEQHADVSAAVLAYWTSRDEASAEQKARGRVDVGGRSGVTKGGHLNRVAQLLARVCIRAGAPPDHVWYQAPKDDPNRREKSARGYTLPGYFRPTKEWDLVVQDNSGPIVAVELKSQNGPSYGNNANNRAEEAIGNAVDLAHAYETGLVPTSPWTGFVFLIEDDDKSRKRGGSRDSSLQTRDARFEEWSYIDRVQVLAERLVRNGYYDCAWALATSRPPNFGWRELDTAVSGYVQFVASLAGVVNDHYGRGLSNPSQIALSK